MVYPSDEPDVVRACQLLPAWFTDRMMTDNWTFGLLTTTGDTIVISSILNVSVGASGEVWLDVDLMTPIDGMEMEGMKFFWSPTNRTRASIAARHIVAAFELAET